MDICSSWTLAEFVDSLRKSLSFKKPTVRGTEVMPLWSVRTEAHTHAFQNNCTLSVSALH